MILFFTLGFAQNQCQYQITLHRERLHLVVAVMKIFEAEH